MSSQMQDFALVFAELHTGLASPLFQPVQVSARWLALLICSSHHPVSVISKLGEGAFSPIVQTIMKLLNSVGSSIDPWGTPFVTGC